MTPNRIPPCMGGFCTQRDQCARYHEAGWRTPSERLCRPGKVNVFRPLVAPRPTYAHRRVG